MTYYKQHQIEFKMSHLSHNISLRTTVIHMFNMLPGLLGVHELLCFQ